MTDSKEIIYFKTQANVENKDMPHGVLLNFTINNMSFYSIKQIDFISKNMLEDEDIDLKNALKDALVKMEKISASLTSKGFESVSYIDYKIAEKEMQSSQQNSFVNNLSMEEKYVYNKTKEFADEYDLSLPGQKQFLSSLRNLIVKGDNINELYLEEHGLKFKKDVNKIFDCGVQGMICDFIVKTQQELQDISNPQIKKRAKMR